MLHQNLKGRLFSPSADEGTEAQVEMRFLSFQGHVAWPASTRLQSPRRAGSPKAQSMGESMGGARGGRRGFPRTGEAVTGGGDLAGARGLGSKTLKPGMVLPPRPLQAPAKKKASELLASLHTSSGSAWRRAPGAENRCRRCRLLAGLPETPLCPNRTQEPLGPTGYSNYTVKNPRDPVHAASAQLPNGRGALRRLPASLSREDRLCGYCPHACALALSWPRPASARVGRAGY